MSLPAVDVPRGTAAFEPGAALLEALAHPLRIAVVRALSAGPRCVHEQGGSSRAGGGARLPGRSSSSSSSTSWSGDS